MKASRFWIVSAIVLLFLACSRGGNSVSSVTAQISRDSKVSPPNLLSADPAKTSFVVPPEIAILEATVRVQGNSFSEVANLIKTNSDRLIESLNNVAGCSAKIIHYQHPTEIYSKKIGSDSSTYRGNYILQVEMNLRDKKDINQRIEQINSCWQAIPVLKLENPQKNTSLNLTLSEILLTIEKSDRFRQKLLTAKFKQLQEVSALSETPSQFNASDTKCTSNGEVKISDRSLSGIELDIDFKCLQFNK